MTISKASIIIPVKNELENLRVLLPKLRSQKREINGKEIDLEIVIVDSGSTDGSFEYIIKLMNEENNIKLHRTRKFHHSITRNLGAKLANGDVLIFLNADAIPIGSDWLVNLIKPLGDNIVASYSRQIPPMKLHFETARLLMTYPPKDFIITKKNAMRVLSEYGVIFSTVSGAIMRNIFFELEMFSKSVPINEDQEFALRLIENEYKIAYASKSRVLHAHFESYSGLFRRYFAFGRGWKKIYEMHNANGNIPFGEGLIRKITRMLATLRAIQNKSKGNPLAIPSILFLGFLSSGLGFLLGRLM